jgi:hypothetical protein
MLYVLLFCPDCASDHRADALWMRRFLFEPLRVVQITKDYVSFRYGISSESRWKMMRISEVVRTVTKSAAYDLDNPPKLAVLVARVSHDLTLADSRQESSPEADRQIAQRAMDNSFEVTYRTRGFCGY